MRTTRQFSITLPHEMAEMIDRKIASGQYATESEVLRDGLRALTARDKAIERWLKQEVVPALKAIKTNPARGRSAAQVRASLAAAHRQRKKSR